MVKLPMCRICLVQNVRMYVVVNRNLHKLYEKLTDIPFVTEDSRPVLACFVCCIRLKQCNQLLRKCMKAEEQFAMMDEDYEPNPLLNRESLELYSGFVKTPIEHIHIVDECQTASIAIKEELPGVCEGLDDIIEPKEEHQNYVLEPENFDNSCLDVADIPPNHSESDVEDDVPLMEFKTEVEEEGASRMKRRASETDRATVAKKLKLDTQGTKLEAAITAERTKKEKPDLKIIRPPQKRTSKPGTYFKEPYKCDQRSFNRVKNMLQHTSTQIDEKPKCDVCQRSFSHKRTLSTHIRKHIGAKPHKCHVCQRSFSLKAVLTKHIRIHTGEKPYKCDICQRSFSVKCGLIRHIRIHTGVKPYKCEVCQHSFSQNGELKIHIRIHTGEKPYKCDVCQRSFSRNCDLTKHCRIHTGEKPYKCKVCQRSFSQNGVLTKHIRTHTAEKPYKCVVCQRSFNQKIHLTNHILIHTDEKPYKCDVCKRSFSQKSSLTNHIRIHSGEKPYKCDICERIISEKGDFTKHIRIHTGEKPYMCDVCQRSFSQKASLTKHFRIHTGEKPYKCNVCQRGFSRNDNLTKHIRIHTGE